jgi:aminoglycoside phosphotransferase (APT) family kinase protein
MPRPRMHADEVDIDAALVGRLVGSQFPEWAELPLEPVRFLGTDNAIYRLGDELAVRLPRRRQNVLQLEKERRWLPQLAACLPLAVPVPLAAGQPADGYPFEWAVYRWLQGEPGTATPIADLAQAASDLAGFLAALQKIDPAGGPPPGEHNFFRGEPLTARDEDARAAIAALGDEVDSAAMTAVWEAALAAPEWGRAPVWIHGDLDARNLLVDDGMISAVIDFGSLGIGDPACDVMVAWKLLSAEARELFCRALAVDDATWARARGWAVSQAAGALTYYTLETNPVLVREARHWLAEVLVDQ